MRGAVEWVRERTTRPLLGQAPLHASIQAVGRERLHAWTQQALGTCDYACAVCYGDSDQARRYYDAAARCFKAAFHTMQVCLSPGLLACKPDFSHPPRPLVLARLSFALPSTEEKWKEVTGEKMQRERERETSEMGGTRRQVRLKRRLKKCHRLL